ncbi:histidine protein methyltransferase 1 homolog [Topomyia yanbarensis]|uniref:histidine protein methyltransferase 1 homolog n=1 Tax=Topomyia yanbarensis TaxID=2498891 RepID=UPI00273AF86A|nr:histidine protein methyltransferase 1 homolog [Topomyia yanbarensis]
MFQFSFNDDRSSCSDTSTISEPLARFECMEITEPRKLLHGISLEPDNLHVFVASVDIQVEYINCLTLPQEDLSDEIQTAELDHSDLIPGKYEGGMKVWECTFDLGELMAEREEYRKLFQNAKVLDLGCGSGILGILAVKLGADTLVFQDYNKTVLEKVTVKNYFFNCSEDKENTSRTVARFYSGEWGSFVGKVQEKFDVILTSETIYNDKNYGTLIDLFKCTLKAKGVVLLAAKTYYFGVGGGMRLLEQALDEDGTFNYRTAWKCDDGVQREILEIRWKQVVPEK